MLHILCDCGDNLDTCGSISDDANTLVFKLDASGPCSGVILLALERVNPCDIWEVLFRQQAKRGDEVSGSEVYACGCLDVPS
jgi:hypothetical protein